MGYFRYGLVAQTQQTYWRTDIALNLELRSCIVGLNKVFRIQTLPDFSKFKLRNLRLA